MRRTEQHRENRRRRAGDVDHRPRPGNRFSPQDAAALQAQLVGTVVLASDPDYDRARACFVRRFDALPQVIVYCEVPGDVVAALSFAERHDLAVVCRSGGHSTAGYSVNDELVIDLSRISYVVVDPAGPTARVGAGTNFETLEAVLGPLGLHVPSGGCPSVCVAGYMQGGGYSFTSRMFGMNCDSVRACTVVTAAGQIVRADADSHPDLFWALRGGAGNNFGVVLEVEYDVHELGVLHGFGLRWPLSTADDRRAAAEALVVWQEHFTGGDTAALTGTEVIAVPVSRDDGPPAPELLIRGMFRGSESECRDALAPLAAACPDGGEHDIWQAGTYGELNAQLMSQPHDLPDVPPSVRASIESRIIADPIGADQWQQLLARFVSSGAASTMLTMESYGGAINGRHPSETAFVHRRARMNLFIWSFWMYPDERVEAERDIVDFRSLVDPLSNGQANQNYPNRDTPAADYPALYWGDNYPRLQRVKVRYDPNQRFRFPQMVHPPSPDT
jgi:FAD/FMN-containing dehydrogenase